LIDEGKVVEAVMLTGVTICQETNTHLRALLVVEELQATRPFKSSRVTIPTCWMNHGTMTQVVRDEANGIYCV
jgi:hypothetical protein